MHSLALCMCLVSVAAYCSAGTTPAAWPTTATVTTTTLPDGPTGAQVTGTTTESSWPSETTRLSGGGSSHRGRVEVLNSGIWGTVCDDLFDDVDVRVVCASLGFGYVGRFLGNTYVGSGTIWMDSVQCTGEERDIRNCPFAGWGNHDCQHSEDVSIECLPETRLAGSGRTHRGRLEVLNNDEWGTVCDDVFSNVDAGVACYSLGFGYNGSFMGNTYGPGTGSILLDDVACQGTETFIGNCPHGGWGVHNCVHNEDASIECTPATRLVGSVDEDRGRLEVLHNGEWGTVCSDGFDENDAKVACYGLGYSSGIYTGNTFGAGTGQIWLDQLRCTGTETFLGHCPKYGDWGSNNCNHFQDVSIKCFATEDPTAAPTSTPWPTTAHVTVAQTTPAPQATTATQVPQTTAATPVPGTTSAPIAYPDLPSPFTELTHEAEMEAVGATMTFPCLNQYTTQFKQILDGQLVKAHEAMLTNPNFCPTTHDVTLIRGEVNLMSVNNLVNLYFTVDVSLVGTETFDEVEACSWQLGAYLSDFSNWKQPIWIDIFQCPRLVFISQQFNLTGIAWKCP